MSLSVEANGREIRVVDTDLGELFKIPAFAGLSIDDYSANRKTIAADAVDEEVPFGAVTDAKLIVIKTDGAGTVVAKINGGTEEYPVNPLLILACSDGGYDSLTLDGDADEDVVVHYLIGG